MTRLAWGAHGERFFEAGVDRGVLFLPDQVGVPWNGLKSVAEAPTGGEPRPYYIDGIKYLNVAAAEEFAATLEAFSSPLEFARCDGTLSIHNGLFVTQQPRSPFGLSYRTRVGNDTESTDHGYKIHLVYNALAAPSQRSNQTLGSGITPTSLSWAISTTPPRLTGIKPTAHFVIDSRHTPLKLMVAIEDILYGSMDGESRLPTPEELIELFNDPGPVSRINFMRDPAFTSVGVGWTVQGGDSSVADGVLDFVGTGAGATANWITPPSTWFSDFVDDEYFAAGYMVENLNAIDKLLRVSIWDGVAYTHGPSILIPAGESRLVKHESVRVPVGASYFQPRLQPVPGFAIVAGDHFRISSPIAEQRRYLGGFFSGDTPDTNISSYEWEAEANSSNSIERSWF